MTNAPQKQNPQTQQNPKVSQNPQAQQNQKDYSSQSKKVEPTSQKLTGGMKDEGGCATSSCSTSGDARK